MMSWPHSATTTYRMDVGEALVHLVWVYGRQHKDHGDYI